MANVLIWKLLQHPKKTMKFPLEKQQQQKKSFPKCGKLFDGFEWNAPAPGQNCCVWRHHQWMWHCWESARVEDLWQNINYNSIYASAFFLEKFNNTAHRICTVFDVKRRKIAAKLVETKKSSSTFSPESRVAFEY